MTVLRDGVADQDRPEPFLPAGFDRGFRPLRRVQHGQEVPGVDAEHEVSGQQRMPESVLADAVGVPRRRVVHLDAQAGAAERPVERVDARGEDAGQRVCPFFAGHVERRLGREFRKRQLEVDLVLDGFVPREQRPRLQESHLDVQDRVGQRFQQALDARGRVLADLRRGVGRRHQHAPLPAHLVLPGRRAVRVEQVTLVEHGVADGAGLVSGVHGPPASSCSIAASQVGMAFAALYLSSASTVSRGSLIHATFGK